MDDTTESPSAGAASATQDGEPPAAGRSASPLTAGLAGLQAGMLGAFGLLAWLGIASFWERRGFWHDENLFATFFYGDDAVRAGFGVKTLPGLALYLIVYSALGFIFALAVRNRFRPRLMLLAALIFALGWFYLSFHVLWKSAMPLVYLLYADRPMIVGHLIYGACLARFPSYLPGNERGPGAGPGGAPPELPPETGPAEDAGPIPPATVEVEHAGPVLPAAIEVEHREPFPPSHS
jgi:hypothetical protein